MEYIPLMCRLLTDVTVLLRCTSVGMGVCWMRLLFAVCLVGSRIGQTVMEPRMNSILIISVQMSNAMLVTGR